jgi:hypothetical protein
MRFIPMDETDAAHSDVRDEELRIMENNRFFSKVQLLQFLVAFFVTAFGILTAYYTTITGIKLDLSQKAESVVVNQLDKRLSNIEVLLNQNFMTKEEFHTLSQELQNRLSRIEFQLSQTEKR